MNSCVSLLLVLDRFCWSPEPRRLTTTLEFSEQAAKA